MLTDVALGGRRQVGVAAVEIVAVHAAAGGAPFGDQSRCARARDVVDRDPAPELGRSALAELLMIDDHDAVGGTDLVGMPAFRHGDGGERAWVAGIGDVDDGGAVRGMHVSDEQRRALDPNLPAARAVEMRHEAGVRSARHKTLATIGSRDGGSSRPASAAFGLRRFSPRRRPGRDPTS